MLFEILGMDTIRFITIYLAQGIVFAVFVFLAIKTLKRDTKRLNLIFSGLYISVAIGLFINFIYGPIQDKNVVYFLNFLTNFFIYFGVIFLMIFNLILLKSEKVITTSKQLVILLIYGVALFCMIFFPVNDPIWGINMETSQSSPDWSLPFYIYVIGVMSLFAIGPSIYFSIKIYKKFEDEQLKKKWKYFIVGLFLIITFMYGVLTSNLLNIKEIRIVMGIIGIIFAITGGCLLYYGVGRQIEK